MDVDPQTAEVLRSILEMLKQQAILSERLLGWVVALGNAIREDAVLEERLTQSPYFHQATKPPLHTIGEMIQNIDALIEQLRKQ